MILTLEVVAALLSATLLFLPIGALSQLLLGESAESGFVLAYCMLALHVVLLAALIWRVLMREAAWSNLGVYCLLGLTLSVLSFGLMEALSMMLNVVDSSHGGSVFIVLFGGIGVALVGGVIVSERTRRAL